jgi:hypothetical protein
MTGVRTDILVVRIHKLPSALQYQDFNAETTLLTADECPLLAEHVLCPISHLCEFYVSSEPVHNCPFHFYLMVFDSLAHCEITRLTHQFKTAVGTRPEIVCIGKTGFRAIWLDRAWETDEYKLWKATFPPGEAALVSPLLPPHHPLPFEPHMIASLSFEEATGRTCVGLRTGAVYILEF